MHCRSKLESLYPPQAVEDNIVHLERQKELGNDTAQREKQKNSFNWQQGCEIADNWSLEHFASTTRAVDKAAPDGEIAVVREVMGCIAHHKLESPYEPNDLEDYIKQQEKQKADRNNAARKEKQKTGRKKKKTPEASPTTSSTANSTNILSPLQLLESFNQN
ncbi:hypothetical protein V6N11_017327 [Hibiscus sabdariffa]|uniref:FRIGIDA-like protein n=1 Tax=Hibiscus sabdariffa TaxID=183260 RepID=A0ABR2TXS0_9ROSI